jgi:hypothetical protein
VDEQPGTEFTRVIDRPEMNQLSFWPQRSRAAR